MNAYQKTVGLFSFLLLFSAVSAMPSRPEAKIIDLQDGAYTTIEERRNPPDRVTMRTEADEKLARSVKDALKDVFGIRVDAENGLVILKGKAKSVAERLEIVKRAQSVAGVKSVRANVRVPGEYNEDEEVKAKNRSLGIDLF